MTVSVIIPTHNRPEHLENNLGKLEKQKGKFEVIIVDDGPEKRADQVVDKFKEKFDLKYFKNPKAMGASYSRNLGAKNSKFHLLAFLDDDDWWDPDYLNKMVEILENKKLDFVVCGRWKKVENTIKPYKIPPEKLVIKDFLVKNPGVTGSNIVIKKDLFEQINGFDEKLFSSNDKDLVIRLLQAGGRYFSLQERKVFVNKHKGEKITSVSKKKVQASIRFFKKYEKEIDKLGVKRIMEAKIYYLLFHYKKQKKGNIALKYLIGAFRRSPFFIGKKIILRSSY